MSTKETTNSPANVLASLRRVANDAARLAERLPTNVGPGHVDHITKASAGKCCANIADRVEETRAAVAELMARGEALSLFVASAWARRDRPDELEQFDAALARCKGGAE